MSNARRFSRVSFSTIHVSLFVCLTLSLSCFPKTGDKFYGPNKPYAPLAGRDATRALGSFEVNLVKGKYLIANECTH